MKKNNMMRAFIFSFLCLFAAEGNAQHLSLKEFHRQCLQQLLSGQRSASSEKIMAAERTTGQSTRDNIQNTFSDSILLGYDPNGFSAYDYNTLLYPINNPCTHSPQFEYAGNFSTPQLTYKTLKRWTIDPNTLSYGLYQMEGAYYDANNNMLGDTVCFADSVSQPNLIFANTFNASSLITKGYNNIWKAGKSDSSAKRFFKYDNQNRLIRDSVYKFSGGLWHLISRTVYSYTTGTTPIKIDHYTNNFDTTFTKPLIEVLKYDNTFDATGRLLTVNTSCYDGNQLAPYVIDTFSYTAGAAFHTSWKEYQYDAINYYWAPVSWMHKQLNTSLLPDMVWQDSFDSIANQWVPYIRYNISYNSNNNPLKMDEYDYNYVSFPSSPNFTTRYYYENINATTPTDEINNLNNQILASPNPFFNQTTIELPDHNVQETGEIKFSLFDETGKEISCNYDRCGNKIILTGNFSSGVYCFYISFNRSVIGKGRLVALKN